jgi:hypothetical protein
MAGMDCPNLSFASIDWYWDYPCLGLFSKMAGMDCPNFPKTEIDKYWDYKVNSLSCR